eukprot:4335673-Pyramimonas_sp.AAC.1
MFQSARFCAICPSTVSRCRTPASRVTCSSRSRAFTCAVHPSSQAVARASRPFIPAVRPSRERRGRRSQ